MLFFLLWVTEDPRSEEYLQDLPDYSTWAALLTGKVGIVRLLVNRYLSCTYRSYSYFREESRE
jgi:hypothetical protein